MSDHANVDLHMFKVAEHLVPLDLKAMLREIDRLKLDKYTKKLDTVTLSNLFVFAQVKQIGSLTDISLKSNNDECLIASLAGSGNSNLDSFVPQVHITGGNRYGTHLKQFRQILFPVNKAAHDDFGSSFPLDSGN